MTGSENRQNPFFEIAPFPEQESLPCGSNFGALTNTLKSIPFFVMPGFIDRILSQTLRSAHLRASRRMKPRHASIRLSVLMRAAHDLHGALDAPPHAGFLALALALAFLRVARRLGDRLETVLVDHL